MKIELHNNDFIHIALSTTNSTSGALVAYGQMVEHEIFGEFDHIESTFEHDDFIDAIRLLGFNLKNVENELIDYFEDNNLYIKASRKGTDNIKYAFLDRITDNEKCSSYDFMGLILKEVLNKENNVSL